MADSDLYSFCFNKSVNLKSAHESLIPLLLSRDIVTKRSENDDNCLDIITSPDRAKLFEKYLGKRYDLKRENSANDNSATSALCRLDFKTTKKLKAQKQIVKVGEKNVINESNISRTKVSTTEILLSSGKSGEIEMEFNKLLVTCTLIGDDKADLNISYSAQTNGSGLSTSVQVKKNEWLNVASVTKELDEKNKTLGIPQTTVSSTEGQDETVYELQFK